MKAALFSHITGDSLSQQKPHKIPGAAARAPNEARNYITEQDNRKEETELLCDLPNFANCCEWVYHGVKAEQILCIVSMLPYSFTFVGQAQSLPHAHCVRDRVGTA